MPRLVDQNMPPSPAATTRAPCGAWVTWAAMDQMDWDEKVVRVHWTPLS